MRLADNPATGGQPPQASQGGTSCGGGVPPVENGVPPPGENTVFAENTVCAENTVFAEAIDGFEAGREAVAEVRDDIVFEDSPAPRRLAPFAAALAATAYRDGVEAGTGRLILLYDPDGQEGWTGEFRLVAQVHADVEPEMAADPLLGEVGWSWLTDALEAQAPGYSATSGTVTRVITEGFGAKEDEPAATGFELRASWCPGDENDLAGDVAAWCDLIAAAAGLPAQPPGTRALRPGGRRRR